MPAVLPKYWQRGLQPPHQPLAHVLGDILQHRSLRPAQPSDTSVKRSRYDFPFMAKRPRAYASSINLLIPIFVSQLISADKPDYGASCHYERPQAGCQSLCKLAEAPSQSKDMIATVRRGNGCCKPLTQSLSSAETIRFLTRPLPRRACCAKRTSWQLSVTRPRPVATFHTHDSRHVPCRRRLPIRVIPR